MPWNEPHLPPARPDLPPRRCPRCLTLQVPVFEFCRRCDAPLQDDVDISLSDWLVLVLAALVTTALIVLVASCLPDV